MVKKRFLFPVFLLFSFSVFARVTGPGQSVYTQKPEDPEGVYFLPANYGFTAGGKTDVSEALQRALDEVKKTRNFGILYLPAGKYLISKTIYIPRAVRLIGYGSTRPEIILADHAPGFQTADSSDKGRAKYMIWFTNGLFKPGEPVPDAGAGTFYSALSNVNLRIGAGNPVAVALRAHFAQHSFISHADIHAGEGKAGLFDVGNEIEDVRFFGGDYGIYTTKPSPGWQFMMTDTWFEGQRIAAIRSQEAGLTIVRMQVKDCPEVLEVNPNFQEKLFMEDCRFENITSAAIVESLSKNAGNFISLKNIVCRSVPVLIKFRDNAPAVTPPGNMYSVNRYFHGLQMDSAAADPTIGTISDISSLGSWPAALQKDIPALPDMTQWANLRNLGAKGDGISDDTRAIQDAIDQHDVIFVPQGWYLVSNTIRLKPNTILIGLNPIATQFMLAENSEAFSKFGGPVPLLETPAGGHNIVNGIGLSTGIDNPRAVACKWMSGKEAYMNDVKFIGGHGSLEKLWPAASHKAVETYRMPGIDPSWDSQYWSLWITNGGGGTFKDIWSASSYASSGVYISNTSTPGHIYALSVEHHVRNEIRFSHVSNWKVYALQLEEESRESTECQPLEMDGCADMTFANLYMFRVIRVNKPYPYSAWITGSKRIEWLNVHNYSQIKYTTTDPIYDAGTQTTIRPWEFNRLFITGSNPGTPPNATALPEKLASGFEFAEGICSDSKGNVYFCDSRKRRIYELSVSDGSLHLVADYCWEPLSLATDSKDRLLVVFKYVPKPGYRNREGKPEVFNNPPDAKGTSFSGWGNSGFASLAYSIDPANADETILALPQVPMASVSGLSTAWYPSNRWRDGHDFNTVTLNRPDSCFVAPDGKTIIPKVYDLARAAALSAAIPGKTCYIADEYDKRTVALNVDAAGYISDLRYFTEKGEFSTIADDKGRVYIADGQINVYGTDGKWIKTIRTQERPRTLTFGGVGKTDLYFTGSEGLYRVAPEIVDR